MYYFIELEFLLLFGLFLCFILLWWTPCPLLYPLPLSLVNLPVSYMCVCDVTHFYDYFIICY